MAFDFNATAEERAEAMLLGVDLHQFSHTAAQYSNLWCTLDYREPPSDCGFHATAREALDAYIDAHSRAKNSTG